MSYLIHCNLNHYNSDPKQSYNTFTFSVTKKMRDNNDYIVRLYCHYHHRGNSICYIGHNDDIQSLNWIISDYKQIKLNPKHKHKDKPFFLIIMKKNEKRDIWKEKLKSISFHHSFVVDLNRKDYVYWKDQIALFAVYMAHYQAIIQKEALSQQNDICVLL